MLHGIIVLRPVVHFISWRQHLRRLVSKVKFLLINYYLVQSDVTTLLKSRQRPMWVFKKELMDQYSDGLNAPYGSRFHRIERYEFNAHDPDATIIAYRVLHTRPKM